MPFLPSSPAPVRILDAAFLARKSRPEDYVWHVVMYRAGTAPARGERLGTLGLGPADVAALGRTDAHAGAGVRIDNPADALAAGLRVVGRALELERREWVRRLIASGYADGFGVAILPERGYHRSVFPGVGLAALAGARVALVTPGGTP